VPFHAQRQGRGAAHDLPGIKRADAGAQVHDGEATQFLDHGLRPDHRAADGVAANAFMTTMIAAAVAGFVWGLIELVFTFLMGRFVFGERASRYEMLGVAALVAGIVLVLHSH
jgi:hypothetical protein